MNETKLIKIYSTKSEVEAELIKNELVKNKIPCNILNINNSILLPELPHEVCGIEIWVPKKYTERAKSILKLY